MNNQINVLAESGKLYFIQTEPYLCFIDPKTDKAITRKVQTKNKEYAIVRLNNELVALRYHY